MISKDIRTTDDSARYDATCKRVLSEKIILAWIMKSCLQEYQDCDVREIAEKYIEGQPQVGEVPVAPGETNASMIHGISGEDASPNEGTVTYDIRFQATAPGTGEPITLIVNVEAQNDFYPGYPLVKRGIYYGSRMISAQYGTEFTQAHYEKIKKVYSVWICTNPPKGRANSITRYAIREDNLVGNVKEPVQNYDLMTVIMLCLGEPGEDLDASVLRLLGVLLSPEVGQTEKRRILQDEFDIQMSETMESEVSIMCNLSKGVMEKGMAKGLEKGMEKGAEQDRVSSLRSLMKTLGLSLEQAMTALEVPDADRPKYQSLVEKQ